MACRWRSACRVRNASNPTSSSIRMRMILIMGVKGLGMLHRVKSSGSGLRWRLIHLQGRLRQDCARNSIKRKNNKLKSKGSSRRKCFKMKRQRNPDASKRKRRREDLRKSLAWKPLMRPGGKTWRKRERVNFFNVQSASLSGKRRKLVLPHNKIKNILDRIRNKRSRSSARMTKPSRNTRRRSNNSKPSSRIKSNSPSQRMKLVQSTESIELSRNQPRPNSQSQPRKKMPKRHVSRWNRSAKTLKWCSLWHSKLLLKCSIQHSRRCSLEQVVNPWWCQCHNKWCRSSTLPPSNSWLHHLRCPSTLKMQWWALSHNKLHLLIKLHYWSSLRVCNPNLLTEMSKLLRSRSKKERWQLFKWKIRI